jgi:hypothetical protein
MRDKYMYSRWKCEKVKGGSLKLVNFLVILSEKLLRILFSVIGGILSVASLSLDARKL